MSGPNKYREWILETIDSLRSRKARPDLERICRMVRRRHGSDPDRTREELEKLIQEQAVLKVSYKGSISYRNAAKVQRKSRKKSEEAAADLLNNNNGDSALSLTDQEEDSEPSPAHQPPVKKKHKSPSSPISGKGSLADSGVAEAGYPVGSGCEEDEEARPGHRIRAHDEQQPGPSGADTAKQSYTGGPSRQEHNVPLCPKLPVGGGGTGSNLDLDDRLVASVQSLSERSLRGGPDTTATKAANRGPVKPLGLKEILGYLSSQERLSEEKLTRGKVKVVMEREVAGGRLRRTRCGNITLPLRGVMTTGASAGRLAKDKQHEKEQSRQESEPMDVAGEKGVQEDNDEEEDPRSSNEKGGPSLVAMTTLADLKQESKEDVEAQRASEEESSRQHVHSDKDGLPGADPLAMTGCSPPSGASSSQCNTTHVEHRLATPDQVPLDTQIGQMKNTQSGFNGIGCETEVGVSSCLLTPTASPRDSGLSEEQGINALLRWKGPAGVLWTGPCPMWSLILLLLVFPSRLLPLGHRKSMGSLFSSCSVMTF
ncbi:sterile alpha motif domain-containing protein 1 isoform X2 [Dunckerocampus dactyliophorus]|uniref:sterile alpha motif domain-containing protein 1 isoform X2 n=1 Tax=Dunckerocampus dactyliophorus TaxID=161453 RepID=UPI00240567EF|nr:sterile alpha motif domain-containing protein 1 isoform X2 [Dunckerocampus dactyliophorus]